MIRAEVRQALWRWREALASSALAAVGVWWGLSSFGIMQWLGWAVFGLGVGLAVAAVQRVRFRPNTDGPGVVTLDERRVTYLGPLDGGVADLDMMVQLDITASDNPHWRLINREGRCLDIPVNAAGVEALFDVFAALPGMKTEHMLAMLHRQRKNRLTVWVAPDHKPYILLH